MELSRIPRRDPPSKGKTWLAGCGIASVLGLIGMGGLFAITFLAMHSMGACERGDEMACRRACFGISSDGASCVRYAESVEKRGDTAEAKRAYEKGCNDGHDPSCKALEKIK